MLLVGVLKISMGPYLVFVEVCDICVLDIFVTLRSPIFETKNGKMLSMPRWCSSDGTKK